ncbi:MAG: hypothetical protein C0596_00975 [Marinilabiliales bacterium]|nr:MAG: hypothetical protein C0596_00975 [Marinilabiliales bacterium]
MKLCDYDLLNHNEASQIMGVSRPTFTRIYSAARQKVAQSFVEVREIIVEGGKVYYDSEWFVCKTCGCDFNHHDKSSGPKSCPLCGSSDLGNVATTNIDDDNSCLCIECGHVFELEPGSDCAQLKCPKCGHIVCRRR